MRREGGERREVGETTTAKSRSSLAHGIAAGWKILVRLTIQSVPRAMGRIRKAAGSDLRIGA